MKQRLLFGFLITGALSTSVAVISPEQTWAGWPEFKQEAHIDRLRNNAWPQPFRGQDANSTNAPFEVMRANGWREFNTLSDAFFDRSNQLTDAGLLKLQQVITQSPPNRKAVFVLKQDSAEETATRLEAVEVAVSGMLPIGDLPPIYVTDISPSTSSGAYQTTVNRALVKTTPTPRLPTFKSLNAPSQQTVAPNAGATGGN